MKPTADVMSDRITQLLSDYHKEEPHICPARARAVTDSDRENPGVSAMMKKARAFRRVCGTLPVNIYDHELIAGSAGTYRRSAGVSPEISWKWILEEIDGISVRDQDPYRIEPLDLTSLVKDIIPYWQGKSIEEAFLARLPEETARIAVDTGIVDNDSKWRCAVGEITPDYQDILFKEGYGGIIRIAESKLKDLELTNPQDLEKADFYQAVIECGTAMIELNQRYAKKISEILPLEKDRQRKQELTTMMNNCLRVPELPPQNFWQAIQMVWTVQLGNTLFENAVALNIGRFDQFMYPFYLNDLNRGTIDKTEAQELISCLWIKLSEWVWFVSRNTASYFAGYSAFQNLTIGGKTADGRDGTNDLSYMCLEAAMQVRSHQPNLSVRIHAACSNDFMTAVGGLVKEGLGFPAIHNDRVGTQMLMGAGLSAQDAQDWSNCGCVVPHSRKVSEWTSACNINLAAAVEFVLNDGKSRITGERYGVENSGISHLNSFDKIKADYFVQLGHLIKHAVIATHTAQQVQAELNPRPLFSAFTEGCLEKGLDVTRGGAKYNIGPVLTGIGLADAANCLTAIQHLIFIQKACDISTLSKALDANWQGYESLRNKALNCPKFGNDLEEVDTLAVEISNFFHQEIRQYIDVYGSRFNSAFMGISNYIPAGKAVGATPCGRKSQDPLTEGCSPHAGTDQTSPTAVMRSTAKINHNRHAGGTLLNIKFTPNAFRTRDDLAKLTFLLRGYMDLDAFHVQFNVIDRDTLLAAQDNPQDYRHLLIRVAGYSARFVTLSREVQDAIIERTSYDML